VASLGNILSNSAAYVRRVCGFVSQPWLARVESWLVRNILPATLASLAKVEAQNIGERTKAGLARAHAAGKRIGRPGLSRDVQRKIAQHVAEGLSAYRISQVLGIDHKMVVKCARQIERMAA
jgi:DNA-binding CsgD family transcriptional regulator